MSMLTFHDLDFDVILSFYEEIHYVDGDIGGFSDLDFTDCLYSVAKG